MGRFSALFVPLLLGVWLLGGLCLAQGVTPVVEDFETTIYPGLPAGWQRDPALLPGQNAEDVVCWKVVDKANLYGEPAWVLDFPSGTRALYFGVVDPSTGEGSYEDGRNRVHQAVLTSEYNLANITATGWIRISFWYLRQVEHYTGDEYDIAQVSYSLDGGATWNLLWKKTSKDLCEQKWGKFVSDSLPIGAATTIQLKFEFDSVDGNFNDFLGWVIDDLRIEEACRPLEVGLYDDSTPPNPVTEIEGRVGDPLTYWLIAEGGDPIDGDHYKWSLAEGYDFPGRITFGTESDKNVDEIYDIPIVGTPESPGSWYVEIVVEDAAGNTATIGFWIKIEPQGDYGVYEEHFDVPEDLLPQLPSGWTKTPDSLWHTTDSVTGINPGNGSWAYFGKDDTPTPNYNTGRRAWGYLTSPAYDVTAYRGNKVVVEFRYLRDVEETTDGAYDKTFVEVRFDGDPWIRIWQKDSTDPSQKTWITAVIDKDVDGNDISVPEDAETIQVRFGFDSVDGWDNDQVGWLVDELKIRFIPDKLRIVTTSLPPAETGAFYKAKLEASGGTPPYTWEALDRLPPQLVLNRNTGEISGVPQVAPGTYTFRIKVIDSKGIEAGPQEFSLLVQRRTTLFFDDFEDGMGKWTVTGLWHLADLISGVDLSQHSFVAYYGQDDATDPNYDTDARTQGYLTSEEIDLGGAEYFKVEFDYWREVEYYSAGGYDQTYLQVRFYTDSGWGDWYTIWSLDSSTMSQKAWASASVGPYAVKSGATKIQMRFVFDSVDKFYNNYVGWLVDNVKVSIATKGDSLPTMSIKSTDSRQRIAFFNYPNPITDVHTTVFGVRGVEAEAIRVEIYDLAGRLVWEGEAPGNELAWHTEDLAGRYLANGVYLYVIYVKVGDSWIHSGIQKLAIYR